MSARHLLWLALHPLSVSAVLEFDLRAQEVLWRVEGVGGILGRGQDLHRLGDFNNDGWDDLMEACGTTTSSGLPGEQMLIVSGYDGSILSLGNPMPIPGVTNWVFRNTTPLGDMNGDGILDYAAHMYDAYNPVYTQTLCAISGANHTLLWTQQIPNAWGTNYAAVLCGDLDVNGDGRRDLVTSAHNLTLRGTIIVYDHVGTELYRVSDPLPNVRVGLDLASMRGDIDGDGCDDFVSTGLEAQGRGALVLFSGRTGQVLRVSLGEQPGDSLVNAGACGDIDGDGLPDYCGGGSFGASVVTAFSSATGQIIHSWRDTLECCMGIHVDGGFDLDQDGVPDLAAGSLGTYMNVFSGRDGSYLWRFRDSRYPSYSCSGEFSAMLAPPPGEQYPLLVYTEGCWSNSTTNPCGANSICPGAVFCVRGGPPGVRAYGIPDRTPGAPTAKSGMRARKVGTIPRIRFTMSNAAPGALAILSVGTSNTIALGAVLPFGLDPLGLPGMTLWASPDAQVLRVAGTSGVAAGYAEFELPLATTQSLSTTGNPFFAQWLWVDPTNFANHGSTAGQRFRVQ
jgi:hypothetical protein